MNKKVISGIWSEKEAVFIILILVMIEYFSFKNQTLILSSLANFFHVENPKTAVLYSVLSIRIIDIIIIFIYAKNFKTDILRCLGIPKDSIKNSIKIGVYACVSFGLIVIFAEIIYSVISSKSLLETALVPKKNTLISQTPFFFHYVFVAGILAPLAEELLFRGVIFSSLSLRFSPKINILFNALIFATAHGLLGNLFPVQFIGGLVFAYLFYKSKSIIAPYLVHSVGNIAIASVVFYFKNY